MLAAQYVSQISLGSIVSIIAILSFVIAALRYLHRLLSEIESIKQMSRTVEEIRNELRAQRQYAVDWQNHHMWYQHGKRQRNSTD